MSMAPSHAPGTVISGRKTVADAATPEAVASAKTLVHWVDITALSSNAATVTIGASGVSNGTQSGITLSAGDTHTWFDVDLSTVFVDVATNGEGVAYAGVSR